MNLGILGSGIVGRTLGAGLASRGHAVRLGTRFPARPELSHWEHSQAGEARVVSFAEAARFGETVVLATDWQGTEHALELARPANLAGKVVVDATNPLDFSGGMPPRLDIGHSDSGGEQVQRWLPGARVVKAFNTVIARHMVDPECPLVMPAMWIAGDHDDAKAQVTELLEELGWRALDAGPLARSRLLEPLALLLVCRLAETGRDDFLLQLLEIPPTGQE